MQERDRVIEAQQPGRRIRADRWRARRHETPADGGGVGPLRFAWRVCAHVKSNAVIFTDARRTLAIGAGQMRPRRRRQRAVMKAQARSLPGRSLV